MTIYYLMSAYTGREAESFKENEDWFHLLSNKAFPCFSPILHSHQVSVDKHMVNMNWLWLDKALLAGWLKHDAICQIITDGCVKLKAECNNCKMRRYDSGVVMVALPSCFEPKEKLVYDQGLNWDVETDLYNWGPSKGVAQELAFAREHHIKVVLAESLVDGKEVVL